MGGRRRLLLGWRLVGWYLSLSFHVTVLALLVYFLALHCSRSKRPRPAVTNGTSKAAGHPHSLKAF